MQLIKTDLIRDNPFNPRYPCSITGNEVRKFVKE
jgi:hypothetical protein